MVINDRVNEATYRARFFDGRVQAIAPAAVASAGAGQCRRLQQPSVAADTTAAAAIRVVGCR